MKSIEFLTKVVNACADEVERIKDQRDLFDGSDFKEAVRRLDQATAELEAAKAAEGGKNDV